MDNVIHLMPLAGIEHPYLRDVEERLENLCLSGVPMSIRQKRRVLDIVRSLFQYGAGLSPQSHRMYFDRARGVKEQVDVVELVGINRFMILHEWITIQAECVCFRDDCYSRAVIEDFVQAAELLAVMIIVPDQIDALQADRKELGGM